MIAAPPMISAARHRTDRTYPDAHPKSQSHRTPCLGLSDPEDAPFRGAHTVHDDPDTLTDQPTCLEVQLTFSRLLCSATCLPSICLVAVMFSGLLSLVVSLLG